MYEGSKCRRERNCSDNGQGRSIISAGKRAKNGHGIGSLRGVVGRKRGSGTGRAEHERSRTGVVSAGITEGAYVGPRLLLRGQTLGFDKDNPGRHAKEPERPQQQEMESMLYVTKRKHVYRDCKMEENA